MTPFINGKRIADFTQNENVIDAATRIADAIFHKPGDPGVLHDIDDRTIAVVDELEKRLAQVTIERDSARMTLEAIGHAEGV